MRGDKTLQLGMSKPVQSLANQESWQDKTVRSHTIYYYNGPGFSFHGVDRLFAQIFISQDITR